MEAAPPDKAGKINRWLPYWAVFQADLGQTLRSWVYRGCVLIALLAAVGYLIYRVGVYREAGIIQPASNLISDLLRWSVLGGVALVIVVTGGCISSERGVVADSVLSRGISRYQYFLGKWHARLITVVGTFLIMGLVAVGAGYFFLHEDLSLTGSLIGIGLVVVVLAVVATCGVAVSAMTNHSLVGIAALWVVVYGIGAGLTLLPGDYPTPDRVLGNLPNIVRGLYDLRSLSQLMGCAAAMSLIIALVGLGFFARRDV
jgi:ABC-type transport system involved in multi-copper enzyme maturation permease subunit